MSEALKAHTCSNMIERVTGEVRMTRKLNRTGSFMFCAALALTCAVPCFAEEGPIPGPAQEARQKLFDRIQLARAQGIGISGYLQAFKALEEQVKA